MLALIGTADPFRVSVYAIVAVACVGCSWTWENCDSLAERSSQSENQAVQVLSRVLRFLATVKKLRAEGDPLWSPEAVPFLRLALGVPLLYVVVIGGIALVMFVVADAAGMRPMDGLTPATVADMAGMSR